VSHGELDQLHMSPVELHTNSLEFQLQTNVQITCVNLSSSFYYFTYLAIQAHNKWYQSRVLATMADGTHFAQLSETVAATKQETSGNSETL